MHTAEARRLEECRRRTKHWRRWGPYLSERAWGTVREDYSPDGTAWDYFPHDHARSRAYRWNEDGLAGICDRHQRICFAIALWNGRDPILKERLFGLTGSEGNHGEDVKEYYFYLDSTPTHSYMRFLYKYPQAPFPYAQLVEENRRRGRHDARVRADRHRRLRRRPLLRRRGRVRQGGRRRHPDPHPRHQSRPGGGGDRRAADVWFRNTWSWRPNPRTPSSQRGGEARHGDRARRPEIRAAAGCTAKARRQLLFTENDTNTRAAVRVRRRALHEGRVPSLRRRRRAGRGQSGGDRHQGRGALPR